MFGRAPAGGRSAEGGSGGGTPAGPCRSFPSPQGQVPSVRASAALPRRARGPKAAEPGGGLKTRAARCEPGGGPGRRVPDGGAGVAPAKPPLGGRRLCSSRGQPCRGGVPLPPPLRGPVSAERPRRGRPWPACLPRNGRPRRERGLSAGAASPRGGGGSPGGRRAAAPLSQRCAALRSAPLHPPTPRPGERSAVSRR